MTPRCHWHRRALFCGVGDAAESTFLTFDTIFFAKSKPYLKILEQGVETELDARRSRIGAWQSS